MINNIQNENYSSGEIPFFFFNYEDTVGYYTNELET